jgi:hypothetical protein
MRGKKNEDTSRKAGAVKHAAEHLKKFLEKQNY